MNAPDDDELTPREVAALAALSRERDPDAALEDRVVRSLERAGVLARTQWWRVGVPLPIAIAAGIALFAFGLAAGRAIAARSAVAGPPATSATAGAPTAVRVVISL